MTKTRILLAGMAISMAPLAEAMPVTRSIVTTSGAADVAFNLFSSVERSRSVAN